MVMIVMYNVMVMILVQLYLGQEDVNTQGTECNVETVTW